MSFIEDNDGESRLVYEEHKFIKGVFGSNK